MSDCRQSTGAFIDLGAAVGEQIKREAPPAGVSLNPSSKNRMHIPGTINVSYLRYVRESENSGRKNHLGEMQVALDEW